MCCDNREELLDQLNPTFLFTWKGTRLKDEELYHSHDFIEMAFILSGHGRYRINGSLYDISEGDIIILNPGQKHQALCTDPSNPTTEFFVGLCDVRFSGFPGKLSAAAFKRSDIRSSHTVSYFTYLRRTAPEAV